MDKTQLSQTEIRIKGKDTYVPSIEIDGAKIISVGGFVKTARLFDEDLIERKNLPEPTSLIPKLRSSPLKADIFTFSQRYPDTEIRFPYLSEIDNWAITETQFEAWSSSLPQESRKNSRQSEKRGVSAKEVTFDDNFVHAIKKIYDETPYRQGRPFWHYGKSFEAVKKENSTYLERSVFVGAYLNDELIGFIKYIAVDEIANIIQIIVMNAHRDKKPMNLLLRETVAVCERKGIKILLYGNYNYGMNQNSPLMEFKRRNSFREVKFPKYYVPLTLKGRIVIALGLHKGWRKLIPTSISTRLIKIRTWVLSRRARE